MVVNTQEMKRFERQFIYPILDNKSILYGSNEGEMSDKIGRGRLVWQ
jgi:hypothetical protein